MKLINSTTKLEVLPGAIVTDRDGESLTVLSFEWRGGASSGRVYVESAKGWKQGFYPHCFDLAIVNELGLDPRAFDVPKTKTMRAFLAKEGPNGTGRVTGLSLEADGAFIYTESAIWDDGNGAGTFREDSETLAIKKFYERVTRNDAGRV